MSLNLPDRPNLEHLKKQAKTLLRDLRAGDAEAVQRFRRLMPHAGPDPSLHDAQSAIARDYGFTSWSELRSVVQARGADATDAERQLFETLFAARDEQIRALLSAYPDLPGRSFYAALVALDAERVLAELTPTLAREKAGPLGYGAPAYAIFSPLARRPERHADVRTIVGALLNEGADADERVETSTWPHNPLSLLFGATGYANHPELAEMLLDAGADPNDGESLYHSTERRDLRSLRLLLARGTRIAGTNALNRMLDSHDLAGVRLLIEAGADPNEFQSLHHAAWNGCSPDIVDVLLAAGADPELRDGNGLTAGQLAYRLGRSILSRPDRPTPEERLVAACAAGDLVAVDAALADGARPDPSDGRYFVRAAWEGRLPAVKAFLRAGFPIDSRGENGGTPLHASAFCGRLEVVQALIAAGAPLELRDEAFDAPPIQWAMYGSGYYEWIPADADHPGVVRALLEAGCAPPDGIWGGDEVVALLEEWYPNGLTS
jgi:ankyrin repeat protein